MHCFLYRNSIFPSYFDVFRTYFINYTSISMYFISHISITKSMVLVNIVTRKKYYIVNGQFTYYVQPYSDYSNIYVYVNISMYWLRKVYEYL